jgi:hypothetical protein
MYLAARGWEGVDGTNLAEDRYKWHTVVKMLTNLWVL